MADNFTCVLCGRTFKSGSGLSSHMRAKHPDGEEVEALEAVAAEPLETAAEWLAVRLEASNGEMLEWARKELAIDPENVMSYRVEEDRVVIIEGPVGYKRTFMLPELEDC